VFDVRLTRELLEDGYTYAEVAQLTKSGQFDRIRRGAYGRAVGDLSDAVKRQRNSRYGSLSG